MTRQGLLIAVCVAVMPLCGCAHYQRISAEEFIERYEAERNVYAYHEYEGVFMLHHHLSYYAWREFGSYVVRQVIYTCPRSELPKDFPMMPQPDIEPWRSESSPSGLMDFSSGLDQEIDWTIPETNLGL